MSRWRLRGAAALAVIAMTVAACDQQPTDLTDDVLNTPGTDTMPTVPTSPDLDASPGDDTSPSPTMDS